jgi:hypothetical protein
MTAFTFSDVAFVRPPAAGGSFRVDYRGAARVAVGGLSFSDAQACTSVPIGPEADRDAVYCVVQTEMSTTPSAIAATLGATSGTLVQTVLGDGTFGRLARQDVWRFEGVSGDSPLTLTQTATGAFVLVMQVISWSARDVGSENIVTDNTPTSNRLDVDQSLVAGDVVIAGANFREEDSGSTWTDSGAITVVGATEEVDRLARVDEDRSIVAGATFAATSTESPRAINFTATGTVRSASAFSLRLRA